MLAYGEHFALSAIAIGWHVSIAAFESANYQILGKPAIPQFEFPVRCLAKSFIVSHDDDSQPFLVELFEQRDDGFTGRAVEIAGRFVGQKQPGAIARTRFPRP